MLYQHLEYVDPQETLILGTRISRQRGITRIRIIVQGLLVKNIRCNDSGEILHVHLVAKSSRLVFG